MPPASRLPPSPVEEILLAHAGFLRGLASRLVADPATADDVVSETYLAAVRRPPEAREGVRGWLAAVARNAARMAHRASSRRARRERTAARPEGCPSPEDILVREAARRRVVDAVLRLEPIDRDVVVLRFYEGLPPREAAARLGLPVETVRTRTRRAIERLRADLDRRHGDRRSWVLALAPMANAEPPPTALLFGVAAMSTKVKALAALLVLALAAGGAWWLREGRRDVDVRPDAAAPSTAATQEGGTPSLAARGTVAEPEATPTDVVPAAPASRSDRPLGLLRGIVASGRTHAPVAGATITARPTAGAVPDGFSATEPPDDVRTATTDSEGRFVLEGVPAGAWRVSVAHADEGEASAVTVASPVAAWLLLYPMPRTEGADEVTFRVVDARQRPVAGARVEVTLDVAMATRVETADADGVARFVGLPAVDGMAMGWATATASEGIGRVSWQRQFANLRVRPDPIAIPLGPAGVIEGTLTVPAGESAAGVVVEAWSMRGSGGVWSSGVATTTPVAADGRWRVDGLPVGEITLLVRPVRGLRMVLAREERPSVGGDVPEYARTSVLVEAGRTAHVDLAMVRGGSLAGRVVAVDSGRPLAGARVEAHLPQGPGDYAERYRREGVHFWRLDGAWPDSRRHPLTFHVLTTDAEGRYALDGMLPGPWRVTVVPHDGFSFDRREDVIVEDGETTALEHVLGAGGSLELVTAPFSSLGARRKGDGTMLTTFLTPSGPTGAATLPALPVGEYELVQVHSDPAQRPIAIADFTIRPGKTTYLDATDLGNHHVTGRLLDRGAPVSGARLRGEGAFGTVHVTDAEGRFSWHLTRWAPSTHTQVWITPASAPSLTLAARVPLSTDGQDLHLPTGVVTVLVRDAAGQSAPGTRVTLEPRPDAQAAVWRLEGAAHGVAGPTGVVTFQHVPPGSYQLVGRFEGTGAEARRTVTVEDRPVEVGLDAPATGSVRIRVVDAKGAIRANVPVSVQSLPASVDPGPDARDRWRLAENRTQQGMRTGADGTIVVHGLAAGLVRVGSWVMAEGGWIAKENAQADATVEPEREIEVVLTLRPVENR